MKINKTLMILTTTLVSCMWSSAYCEDMERLKKQIMSEFDSSALMDFTKIDASPRVAHSNFPLDFERAYGKLEELFENGTAPTAEDMAGWYVGKSIANGYGGGIYHAVLAGVQTLKGTDIVIEPFYHSLQPVNFGTPAFFDAEFFLRELYDRNYGNTPEQISDRRSFINDGLKKLPKTEFNKEEIRVTDNGSGLSSYHRIRKSGNIIIVHSEQRIIPSYGEKRECYSFYYKLAMH